MIPRVSFRINNCDRVPHDSLAHVWKTHVHSWLCAQVNRFQEMFTAVTGMQSTKVTPDRLTDKRIQRLKQWKMLY